MYIHTASVGDVNRTNVSWENEAHFCSSLMILGITVRKRITGVSEGITRRLGEGMGHQKEHVKQPLIIFFSFFEIPLNGLFY